MRTLLNVVPLDILILIEARIVASGLKLSNIWKTPRGHGGIEELIIVKPTYEITVLSGIRMALKRRWELP